MQAQPTTRTAPCPTSSLATHCRAGQRCRARAAAAPRWNPQNTDDPQVMPSPELTPLQAVTVQLDAMQQNDTPWPNHGVQTMYTFAEDCGSMERSRYFGFSKDLYHLDHFLGAVKIACAALVDCQAYTILTQPLGEEEQALASVMQGLDPLPEGMHAVYVRVGADAAGAPGGVFEFRLVQRQQGLRAGCWMVKSCRRVVPS